MDIAWFRYLKSTMMYARTQFSNTVNYIAADDLTTLFSRNILMITSSNGNIFRVTGPLCGECTGDGELRCFLWPASEETIK